MASRKSALALEKEKETLAFLEDFFSDTRTRFLACASPAEFAARLDAKPDFVFANSLLLESAPEAIIKKLLQASSRTFLLGNHAAGLDHLPRIPTPIDLGPFQKTVLASVRVPESLHVLVIDDEPEVCQGIKEFLEFRRAPAFEVDFALNGLEGFRKIEQWKPDVTILDIKMPVKSGLDLYRDISRKYRDLRIIILTAAVAADEIAELRKSGCATFVEKGAQGSGFPEMLNLIKKQWIFS